MDKIEVTVVCLTYNHRKYIRDCLEGIITQKTDFRFRVLVHDDASTDGTQDIIIEYAKENPGIIVPVLEKENRFQQIREILPDLFRTYKSTYIAMCEGDDYWCDVLKLQKQFDYMREHEKCSMICHNTRIVYLNKEKSDRLFFDSDKIFCMTAEEVFDEWKVHTSSYFFKNDFEIFPVWGRDYWSGDYTMLTIAYAYGSIDVLPDVMSVYRFGYGKGETIRNLSLDQRALLEKIRCRKDYLYKYIDHFWVDKEVENVLRNRIMAIQESTAVQELDIQIREHIEYEKSEEEKVTWIVDAINNTLIRKACLDPSQGTENAIAALNLRDLGRSVGIYINHIIKTKYSVHFTFLPWFARYYGEQTKEKELLLAIAASPENTVGWGMYISGSPEEKKEKALLLADRCEKDEDKIRLNELKSKIIEASQENNYENYLLNLNAAMELNVLDPDLLYFKAFLLYTQGDMESALDEIGVFALFYELDEDMKTLFENIVIADKELE